jgi:hypothetical protein
VGGDEVFEDGIEGVVAATRVAVEHGRLGEAVLARLEERDVRLRPPDVSSDDHCFGLCGRRAPARLSIQTPQQLRARFDGLLIHFITSE